MRPVTFCMLSHLEISERIKSEVSILKHPTLYSHPRRSQTYLFVLPDCVSRVISVTRQESFPPLPRRVWAGCWGKGGVWSSELESQVTGEQKKKEEKRQGRGSVRELRSSSFPMSAWSNLLTSVKRRKTDRQRKEGCRAEGTDITGLIDAVATEAPGEGEPTVILTQECLPLPKSCCALWRSDSFSSLMSLPLTYFIRQIFKKFQEFFLRNGFKFWGCSSFLHQSVYAFGIKSDEPVSSFPMLALFTKLQASLEDKSTINCSSSAATSGWLEQIKHFFQSAGITHGTQASWWSVWSKSPSCDSSLLSGRAAPVESQQLLPCSWSIIIIIIFLSRTVLTFRGFL